MVASLHGNTEVVLLLLKQGATVSLQKEVTIAIVCNDILGSFNDQKLHLLLTNPDMSKLAKPFVNQIT